MESANQMGGGEGARADDAGAIVFAKGHGLGNDYLVVDAADLSRPLSAEQAVLLCDRHYGAGSDGVLVANLAERPQGPFGLRIVNPDGTEAEKSGNGLRIFAAWLHDRGAVTVGDWFEVRLARDTVRMCVEGPVNGEGRAVPRGDSVRGGAVAPSAGAVLVTVEMGRAQFSAREAGFVGPGSPGRPAGAARHFQGASDAAAGARPRVDDGDEVGGGVQLDLPGGNATVHPVSLGNPHCVVLVDALERDDFVRRAPALCGHAAFPAGTNVQWARVAGPRLLEAWIWERGAGETLASGSSACAVAAVAARNGLVRHGPVEVRMPGGSVQVEVGEDYSIRLEGPAQMIYQGRLAPALARAWEAAGRD